MDFVEGLRKSGVPFQKRPSDVSLVTAASREIRISWSIKLHFKIHDYSWDFDFLVARRLPVGVILGADFVCHSGMVLNPSRGSTICSLDLSKSMNFSLIQQARPEKQQCL